RSRSMLVELQVDNAQHLLPGLFAEVTLRVASPRQPIVPADALVARGDKLFAPVVEGRKVHFVEVKPGTNNGQTVEIRSGLRGGETVARAVPSELGEGAPVQPVTPEQQKRE